MCTLIEAQVTRQPNNRTHSLLVLKLAYLLGNTQILEVLSLLTSWWSLTLHTGPRVAHSSGEHDPSLRQGQGGLVDQHSTLQSGEDQEGSHGEWGWSGGWGEMAVLWVTVADINQWCCGAVKASFAHPSLPSFPSPLFLSLSLPLSPSLSLSPLPSLSPSLHLPLPSFPLTGGQDGMQEEPRPPDQAVPEGRARTAAQLPQGGWGGEGPDGWRV